jgi:hypothetical protein
MIIIPLDGKPAKHFEDYNELFDTLIAIENRKLDAKIPNLIPMSWSFTIHPPRQVAAFYAHLKDSCEGIKEAYEEGLPLIEFCNGAYRTPTYIALTPNVNLDYLKKKWCIDYCTWHHLVVRAV